MYVYGRSASRGKGRRGKGGIGADFLWGWVKVLSDEEMFSFKALVR